MNSNAFKRERMLSLLIARLPLKTLLLVRPSIEQYTDRDFQDILSWFVDPLKHSWRGKQILGGQAQPLALVYINEANGGGSIWPSDFTAAATPDMPTWSWATNWKWDKRKESWFKWQLYFFKAKISVEMPKETVSQNICLWRFLFSIFLRSTAGC